MTAIDRCAAILGGLARRDEPLGPRTTYRVGGTAALFVEAASIDDLRRCARAVAVAGVDSLIVGKGSNLLVADAGFPGLAIALIGEFEQITVSGTSVIAGGAASLPVVARKTVAAGLTGFEWAVGVPGSIGGAVRMNAGGHGADMAATLRSIRVLDLRTGEDAEVNSADLDLGYRRSNVRADAVVCSATIELESGSVESGKDAISEIVAWRRANQPGGQNAGSVFTNPVGDSAGRLIDEAGARGMRLGTAEVSPKHANFIQADAGGSADDVFALMRRVQALVAERCGVTLHPETVLVGFPGEVDQA